MEEQSLRSKKSSPKLTETFVKRQLLFDLGREFSGTWNEEEVRVEKPFTIIKYEFPIYIDGRSHGQVDFVIKYRQCFYFLESKITDSVFNAFWDASKVLAYTKIHNYFNHKRYKPAILLKYEEITTTIQKATAIMGLELFGVYWSENEEKLIIENIFERRQ